MHDPVNMLLRKLAAKLLCLLAYDNEETQTCICKHAGFNQLSDRICINSIPEVLKEKIRANPGLINDIKEVQSRPKQDLYWSYPVYSETQNEFDFPDPLHCLIGFYSFTSDKSMKKSLTKFNTSFQMKTSYQHLKLSSIPSPSARCSIEVRPISLTKRKNLTQTCSQSAKISNSVIYSSKDAKVHSKELLESVIEENTGSFNVRANLNGTIVKSRHGMADDSKKTIYHKTYYSQQIKMKANVKKLESTILNITQTIRNGNKKLGNRNNKICMTIRPNSTNSKTERLDTKEPKKK
eukprot:TRINITY_DN8179_c0_g1_i6.p1 TRINITY_DN8179_c0_g1~~TRINITY_DN8179_c0_g1_i6.p1  ORF type:complete len:294 (+),score=66.77 TRINITY_DN8179_c0_g1_i6:292-1173(+)